MTFIEWSKQEQDTVLWCLPDETTKIFIHERRLGNHCPPGDKCSCMGYKQSSLPACLCMISEPQGRKKKHEAHIWNKVLSCCICMKQTWSCHWRIEWEVRSRRFEAVHMKYVIKYSVVTQTKKSKRETRYRTENSNKIIRGW